METGLDEVLLDLNPGGWIEGVTTEKDWCMLYALDASAANNLIIAGAPSPSRLIKREDLKNPGHALVAQEKRWRLAGRYGGLRRGITILDGALSRSWSCDDRGSICL